MRVLDEIHGYRSEYLNNRELFSTFSGSGLWNKTFLTTNRFLSHNSNAISPSGTFIASLRTRGFQIPPQRHPFRGNRLESTSFILDKRNVMAVSRHPNPYLTLREKLMDDASSKYLVGQLTSAIIKPVHIIWASI